MTGDERRADELASALVHPWLADASFEAVDRSMAPRSVQRRADLALLAEPASRTGLGRDTALVRLPRRDRITLGRRLQDHGLRPVAKLVLVPGWPATEHALSLGPALADGVRRQLGTGAARAALIGRLGRAPWSDMAAAVAPEVAIVASRGPRRPFAGVDWPGEVPATGHIRMGLRSDARTMSMMLYGTGARHPLALAKVAVTTEARARIRAERDGLSWIAPLAGEAGFDVPHLIRSGDAGLAQTIVAGTPGDRVLRADPSRIDDVVIAVFDRLRRWRDRYPPTELNTDLVHGRLLEAAGAVAAADPGVADYCRRFIADATRLVGAPTMVGPGHRDLTVANITIGDGTVGLLDWEASSATDLLMGDDWYLLVDAVATARDTTHADALDLVLNRHGFEPLRRRLSEAVGELGWSQDQADLAFRSCWLDHAADDVARGRTNGRFIEVVRRLARGELMS